jgi:SAM-dependent methyltransferase/N-acetylglutamate synthase-like GNAT family acetyltransferase
MSGGRSIPAVDAEGLRAVVRDHYAARIASGTTSPGATCCGPRTPNVAFEAPPSLEGVPSFGCGDPAVASAFAAGETVVDLGSGAGRDAFAVAAAVGPSGRVIGVDMTPAMVERARSAAKRLELHHVEFREGLIERLPIDDAVADAVISNCVLNLAADVPLVLAEALRVLRPGGRLRISDTFRVATATAAPDRAGWCACVDGAHDPAVFVAQARAAGFIDVRIDPAEPSAGAEATYGALLTGVKPDIVQVDAATAGRGSDLLAAAGLPVAGWHAPGLRRWHARDDGRVVGIVALEVHGRFGLLRSWAVTASERGRGLGAALLARALGAARELGLRGVAALTTTAPDRLRAAGMGELAWSALPPELLASDEFRGACPSSARAFYLEVEP